MEIKSQNIKPEQHHQPSETTLRMKAKAFDRTPLMEAKTQSVEELLHELRVNQIELEMQNETLRQSQTALEQSRDRYTDLYEFAPVGYITLTRDGLIRDINLTGAALLREDRKKLIRHRFANFISVADHDRWHQNFMRVQQHGERQSCELLLKRGDGTYMHAQLDGLHWVEESVAPSVRLAFTDITRFKEVDERYRRVFEQATDGIVITDVETGGIIDLNQALADMVGRNKSELIGKPLNALCPPQTGDPLCNTVLIHPSDKHGSEIETQFLAKSGEIHQVVIKMSVMSMSGREVEFGIVRDVTERHRAQAREHRLRHILDNTLDMIFIFSPDTLNFVYMNNGGVKTIGYSREEMLHMTPADVIPLVSEAESRAFIAPLVNGKKSTLRFETTLKRKDGRTFPAEVQLQLVKEDGDEGLFVAVVRDIARRKIAETELRRQKNLMWQVIDMDPSMIFVRDTAGRFLLANQTVADFYAVTIQELVGKSSRELKPDQEEVPGFLSSDREVIESGRESTSTEAVVMPDGLQHWYLVIKRPMLQPDGSINTLGIAADISELKLSGIRLDESYKELQRLALHLENVRAEERTQIARNLHDEMGATLAALKMRIAWLASKLPDGMPHLADEVGHISELISEGIKTVRQVVSDLRPNLLNDVGLIAAVKDYVNRFQRDTEIKCAVVLPVQDFALDENQSVTIFRIVQESLSNVVHHARASNVGILFSLNADSLQVEIEDDGIGFDMAGKEKSFGLIGIKERALMIGGTATIESAPELGTRVSLRIPVARPSSRPVIGAS
ncbi:MAG: PAS domain S-box protein [Pseudomonadota bacterium]